MSDTAYHHIRATPAAAPPGCPVHHGFTPLDPDYIDDPYPIAKQLREASPVVFAEKLGYIVVTPMDLVTEVFLNPDVYSSENVQDPVWPIGDEAAAVLSAPDFNPVAVMSNRQEPDHGRIRKYTRNGFSNRRNKVLEPYIRRRAAEMIEQMKADGSPADFIAAVAQPLPAEVVFRFMGFPEADDARLMEWCGNRLAFSWGQPSEAEQVEIAEKMVAYWRYVREFTASKQASPGDDFASELLADHEANPDDLTYLEVESILYGLSFAGHEPVTLLLGNALLSLLPRRDDWTALCQAPERIPDALEEIIRWNSPQIGWRRVATQDTSLGGVDIPAGTQIFLNLGAANHDPAEFDDPERFDRNRANARNNISFGKGNHYCLGAKLARFEARIVLEELMARLPSLHLAEEQEIARFPNVSFRGTSRLDVAWEA